MTSTLVSIVTGSASDLPVMQKTGAILEQFGIAYDCTVSSAHRNPGRTIKLAQTAADRGVKVIIAGAGLAAHLAGTIAAHTNLPVIGVPLAGSSLGGMDALFSTAQMPAGVPVATVAIGEPGAKNAAYLALRILSLHDQSLAEKLTHHRKEMAKDG